MALLAQPENAPAMPFRARSEENEFVIVEKHREQVPVQRPVRHQRWGGHGRRGGFLRRPASKELE